MNTDTRRRSAFTLIELLVVIAILAVLAALAAGTYFRIRASQQVNSTESTLSKLNTGIERLWSAERDQAEKEFTGGALLGGGTKEKLMGYAGGPNETDRAKAMYLMMRLKYEFPQTFPEAKASLVIPGVAAVQPKLTFRNVPNTTPTTTDEANLQAAALLYIILSEKSARGETFDTDSLNGFIAERAVGSSGNFRMFIDSWGTPITYVRFLQNAEIDEQPFARNSGNASFANSGALPAGLSNNPFDVSAKFTRTGWANFEAFCTAAGVIASVDAPDRREQFLRRNFLPSVVSAGANRTWDGFDVRGRSATPYSNVGIVQNNVGGGVDGIDNVYGYRLRKFGAKGD